MPLQVSDDVRRLNPGVFSEASEAPQAKGKGRIRVPQDPEHPSQFDSKLEERAWHEWVSLSSDQGRARFHSITFHMAGGNYTPDFDILRADGERWFIEVKPNNLWNTHLSGRSSKRALKQAAVEFRDYGRFFVLFPGSDGWTLEEIKME